MQRTHLASAQPQRGPQKVAFPSEVVSHLLSLTKKEMLPILLVFQCNFVLVCPLEIGGLGGVCLRSKGEMDLACLECPGNFLPSIFTSKNIKKGVCDAVGSGKTQEHHRDGVEPVLKSASVFWVQEEMDRSNEQHGMVGGKADHKDQDDGNEQVLYFCFLLQSQAAASVNLLKDFVVHDNEEYEWDEEANEEPADIVMG